MKPDSTNNSLGSGSLPIVLPKEISSQVLTPRETAVLTIWEEVLHLTAIDVEQDFFNLGGDSLRALDVVAKIRTAMDVELPLLAFFEQPTIRYLAAIIDELVRASFNSGTTLRHVSRGEGDFPLSYSQRRFWLLQQLDPESYIYNEPRAVRIQGAFDLAALQNSLSVMYNQHEILRVTFASGADGPMQRIGKPGTLPLTFHDLTAVEVEGREQAAKVAAAASYRMPFNLSDGPVIRAELLRLNSEDHILIVVMHHIISDGHTAGLFFDQLGQIYNAFVDGEYCNLPALPLQYVDYAAWEHAWLDEPRLAQELSYWKAHLNSAPNGINLPLDLDRNQNPDHRGQLQSVQMSSEDSDALQILANENGTTLFSVLLTGLKILLFRWSKQDDIIVGTVASNRSREQTERMLGCFVNFLPLRDKIVPEEPAAALLQRVKQTVMNAFAHQECPFDKIVEVLNPGRALSINPIHNVALLMLNFPQVRFRGETSQSRFLNIDTEVALLDLRLLVSCSASGLTIACEYKTALFRAETIHELLAAYVGILRHLVENPNRHAIDFPLPLSLAVQAETAKGRNPKQTIAVSATFTAELVAEPLQFWCNELEMDCNIEIAAYNQVFQQLLDPTSLLRCNSNGFNIVLVRMEDWHQVDLQQNSPFACKVDENRDRLIAALRSASSNSDSTWLLCFCPSSTELCEDRAKQELIAVAEMQIEEELDSVPGVHVITSRQLEEFYPVLEYEDSYSNRIAHIPYTTNFFIALATMAMRRIFNILSPQYKAIAVDCDQTLWSGVCGEDGPNGVVVDGPRKALQQFLIDQGRAGMLLCLSSKNIEADVLDVFSNHPGMVLQYDDIAASRINWQPKSENLRSLAAELNIGVDTFIFLDDNPLECAEVEANCPEALTLQLPEDIQELPVFIKQVWAFDHFKTTDEDRDRNAMYRDATKREELRSESESFEEFLAGLNLDIQILPMAADELGRVAQLTQRTNQFNCTTKRRSEAELRQLLEAGRHECLIVRLRDRFGDYGLIGAAIFEDHTSALFMDSMLLSCRALGRRVEHALLAHLGRIARERGAVTLDIPFQSTEKNRPALDFLRSFHVSEQPMIRGAGLFRFPVETAIMASKYVTEMVPKVLEVSK